MTEPTPTDPPSFKIADDVTASNGQRGWVIDRRLTEDGLWWLYGVRISGDNTGGVVTYFMENHLRPAFKGMAARSLRTPESR